MAAVSRIGDFGVGVCSCHGTPVTVTIISGAPSVIANEAAVAHIGCVGIASCGHASLAIVGSADVFAEESAVHRIGDTGVIGGACGTYTMVSGSPDTFAND